MTIKEYKVAVRVYKACAKGKPVDCSKCIGCTAKIKAGVQK